MSESKKMTKFPSIIDYLKQYHEEVWGLFDDSGMYRNLIPRRGRPGITFLLPDEKLTAEIREVLDGETPEDATDMLSALILTNKYGNTTDFGNADSVSTILGKELPIKTVSSTSIVLANGARLSRDKRFKPFERQGKSIRGNISVWFYKGKMWDYNSAEEAAPKGTKKKTRRSNAYSKSGYGKSALKAYIRKVENAVLQHWSNNDGSWPIVASDKKGNPFIKATASILSGLDEDTLNMVMPFIGSASPVTTFYVLVNSPLVSVDQVLDAPDWRSPAYSMATINKVIRKWMKANKSSGALLCSTKGQKRFYNALRKAIKHTPMSDFVYKKEQQFYSNIVKNNQLPGLDAKVLPEASHHAVTQFPNFFRLVNIGAYELPINLAMASSQRKLTSLFRETNRRYNVENDKDLAAYISAENHYAATAKMLQNEPWLEMSRVRFRKSLLASLPFSVDAGLTEKDHDADVVDLKIHAFTYTNDDEDFDLSVSASCELRDFIQLRGGLPEEFRMAIPDRPEPKKEVDQETE